MSITAWIAVGLAVVVVGLVLCLWAVATYEPPPVTRSVVIERVRDPAPTRDGKQLLDKFFQDVRLIEPLHQSMVWYILTALRGPDSEDDNAKWYSTAVIRAVVCRGFSFAVGADTNYQFRQLHTLRDFSEDQSPHFNTHIRTAHRALEELGYINENGEILS